MKVADAMIRSVVTTREDVSLRHVAKLMRDRKVGSVVVMRDRNPVGMITEGDVVAAIATRRDFSKVKASHLVKRPLILGVEHLNLEDAVKLMVLHNVKRLPIVRGKRLVGIVSFTDFARYGPLLNDILRKALDEASTEAKKRFTSMAPPPPPPSMYA